MSEEPRTVFRSVSVKWVVTLSVLGVAMLLLYRFAIHSKGVADIVWFLKLVVVQIVIYLAAAWLSLRTKDSRLLLVTGLIFAALFRLSIVFSPPYLSDDIYRYVWDGRVQAAGINPYRYIPAEKPLAHLRDEKIYPNINRRDYAHTMYPPVAEGAFLLITRFSESVTWMKAVMVGCEAVAVWTLIQLLVSFGFARQRVLIYAWHPLAVWEFAGSGHVDALAIAFIALALLARRKHGETLTGLFLACATCVKFFPAVLLPALYMRRSWRMLPAFVATVLLAYLPYLSVGPLGVLGFLPGYASERGMVSGEQFFLLTVARKLLGAHVPASAYLILAVAVLGIVSVWLMKDGSDDIRYLRNGLIVASVFMFLLAPHFSWYFVWLIPFLCFIPSIPVFYLTFASFLLYLTWLGDSPDRVLMLKTLIFAPALILGIIEIWLRRPKRGLLCATSVSSVSLWLFFRTIT
jgi:alpha-1,6-mannosyltransferase